jgi:hypothetical protein
VAQNKQLITVRERIETVPTTKSMRYAEIGDFVRNKKLGYLAKITELNKTLIKVRVLDTGFEGSTYMKSDFRIAAPKEIANYIAWRMRR